MATFGVLFSACGSKQFVGSGSKTTPKATVKTENSTGVSESGTSRTKVDSPTGDAVAGNAPAAQGDNLPNKNEGTLGGNFQPGQKENFQKGGAEGGIGITGKVGSGIEGGMGGAGGAGGGVKVGGGVEGGMGGMGGGGPHGADRARCAKDWGIDAANVFINGEEFQAGIDRKVILITMIGAGGLVDLDLVPVDNKPLIGVCIVALGEKHTVNLHFGTNVGKVVIFADGTENNFSFDVKSTFTLGGTILDGFGSKNSLVISGSGNLGCDKITNRIQGNGISVKCGQQAQATL